MSMLEVLVNVLCACYKLVQSLKGDVVDMTYWDHMKSIYKAVRGYSNSSNYRPPYYFYSNKGY